MLTVGELKDGYCSMGKDLRQITPAIQMIIATTEAKTGLSIKNLENIAYPRLTLRSLHSLGGHFLHHYAWADFFEIV